MGGRHCGLTGTWISSLKQLITICLTYKALRAVACVSTYQEVPFLFVDRNCQFVHFTHDLVPFCTFKKLGTLLQQIH